MPHADAQRLIDALAAAGAGGIGAYERCAYTTDGTGTFRPLDGAAPAIGEVGRIEVVEETRVEMVLPRRLRSAVLRALLAAHPYEAAGLRRHRDRGAARIHRGGPDRAARAADAAA